ncbi:MAG: hypothetical protein KGN76_14490 [Acidobacteriota bacterium]|nr:hypothetical protein [Acidobacteriota bacterium]
MSIRFRPLIGAAALAAALPLLAWACSGSSYSSPSSPSPTPPPSTGGAAITINVVGMNGNQSFAPDTTQVAAGQQIVFHNSDSITHRIVQDSGLWDTGNLAPGASSAPITINSTSEEPYHCSIHPSMVGSINGTSTTSTQPCQGPYCG